MEVQTEAKKTDAELLVGGPAGDHGKPMPKEGDVHPDLKTTNTNTAAAQKYEINGKTFNSAQDMSKYVADLERKVLNPQPVLTQPINQGPQKELIDGRPVDEVMFTDPEKYTKYLENKVETKIYAARRQEEVKAKFWSDFYQNNPDLRGREHIVDGEVAKNWQRGETWDNLSFEAFAEKAASSTRFSLKKAGLANATEVENNSAATLSSSGEGSSQMTTQRKATSYVDELKAMSAKRRSKAK